MERCRIRQNSVQCAASKGKKINDTRLKCVPLHDVLHGFRPGRGCSTAIVEVKLATQLGSLEQTPFFSIFVDLWKAYDAMVRDRCLKVLRGVGVGRTQVHRLPEDTLRSVKIFKYLGRNIARDDCDTPAIRHNLKRAHQV